MNLVLNKIAPNSFARKIFLSQAEDVSGEGFSG